MSNAGIFHNEKEDGQTAKGIKIKSTYLYRHITRDYSIEAESERERERDRERKGDREKERKGVVKMFSESK